MSSSTSTAQQHQNTGNKTMAAQSGNIISNEMKQHNTYQQLTYANTSNVPVGNTMGAQNYGSPIVTTNVQKQTVFQSQQQVQTDRGGREVVGSNSSELTDQGAVILDQANASVPIMYVPDSRGVSISGGVVGAEQYQMVTTTTPVSGSMVMSSPGAEQHSQPLVDNNDTPRLVGGALAGSVRMPSSETG